MHSSLINIIKGKEFTFYTSIYIVCLDNLIDHADIFILIYKVTILNLHGYSTDLHMLSFKPIAFMQYTVLC